ncbi:hypothetical protein H0H81_009164 [Sphagnurus paluster]|uniref:Methylosome subunit pICln n=1 Tax=Sphagnurus paluster TaxID=117069 RepID=A0A9P7FVL1_9AGAR|nr:hypothetical protein H0H81_009164 [Sphagnurus paluster]
MPAVTLINAVPKFSSPEEHLAIVGSTPASFSDIPPILRHQEENVTIKLDPAVEGFNDEDGAQGSLYVITSVLVFMSTTGRGFQIEYPAITLHAISRGEYGPSIYCQLDESDPSAPAAEDSEEDTELRELTIIPQNGAALEPIFESLSMCAALHPDKDTGDDDAFEDDAFIDGSGFETFTGDEAQELSEVGRTIPPLQAALAHLESIIYDPHDLTSQANGVNEEEHEDAEEEEPEPEVSGSRSSVEPGAVVP